MTRKAVIKQTDEVPSNPDLNSLQKYDEYYKNNKNIVHEAYYYKKPRISKEFQVSPEKISNNHRIETDNPLTYIIEDSKN